LGYEKILALCAVVWIIVCLIIAFIGGKHLNKPHAKFEKVPIILGIAVAGAIGILAVIGYYFFE